MSEENGLHAQIPAMLNELNSGKYVEFETHGFSMIPLLHDGGDRVILRAADGKLKIGDVALCRTSTGRYVLHRVIAVDVDGYTFRGDNCVKTEKCLSDTDIIGVAYAFIRNGKLIRVDSFCYKVYCKFRRPILMIWRKYWRIVDSFMQKQRR